jgi:hypothetical protein
MGLVWGVLMGPSISMYMIFGWTPWFEDLMDLMEKIDVGYSPHGYVWAGWLPKQ